MEKKWLINTIFIQKILLESLLLKFLFNVYDFILKRPLNGSNYMQNRN